MRGRGEGEEGCERGGRGMGEGGGKCRDGVGKGMGEGEEGDGVREGGGYREYRVYLRERECSVVYPTESQL